MNNSNVKVMSSMALVAMMATVFSPVVINAASTLNDPEFTSALAWGYDTGLTKYNTEDAFRPFGTLRRDEASKFLSEFASEVLGIEADASASCTFADISSADPSLVSSIALACGQGILKGSNGSFLPAESMTKAQFVTALVRALHGNVLDETTSPWWKNYYDWAYTNEITKEASALSLDRPITRYEALLMLYRGANPEEVDPTDPVEVKKGALEISLGSDTLANNSQIPSTGTVKFASVNLSATEDLSVRSIEVEKLGLATIPSSTRVWFEKNGVRVSGRAAFTSEGKAVVSFAPAFVIKAGAKETLDLYVELSTSAGFDLQFRSAKVDSTAVSVGGSFVTPVLRTVNYTVIEADFNAVGGGSSTSASTNGIEIGAFSVAAVNTTSETRNAKFKSITLRQNENASLSNLGNIVLERNGAIVAKDPIINGRELTFSVNDTILDGTTATYYIKAVVNTVDQSTDSYEFELRNTSDLNVVEATTAFRATVTGAPATLAQYDVTGGDITFARDTSVALSDSVAPGTQNVVFLKGTIKSNQAITLEDPTVAYALGLDDDDLFDQFSTLYLQIGGSTFAYSPVNGGSATSAQFNGTAVVDGTVQVRLYATLKSNAPAATIKFNALGLSSFGIREYVSNGNTVNTAIGTIETVTVNVEQSNFNVTRTDGKGNSAVAAGTTEFTVVKYNLTSNQGNGVRVSRATFNVAAPALANNNVTLTLLVNGTPVHTKNVNGSTITFDGFNTDVKAGSGATIEVKANFAEAFNTGTFALNLAAGGIYAVDLNNSQVVSHNSINSAVYTIASAGAVVSASNNPILAKLLLSPSSTGADLMAFRVKAENDTVKLRDLTFSGTDLDKLSNFRVVDANGNTVATATTATTTAVTFANIPASAAPAIAKDVTAIYRLVADVNSDSVGSVAISLTNLAVRASNGSTVTPTFTAIASATHAIAENSFVVTKAANSGKGLTTSALRFTVTAAGKDAVTLDEITFNNLIAGYTGASELRVYRTSTTTANLAGSLTGDTGIVTLTANNTVDAGTSATFIVVVANTVVDSNSSSQDWSVSIEEIEFEGGLMATDYDNVGGNLPLTESK